jgi:hypothetical protein
LWGDCLPKTQVCANSKEDVYGLKPAQCRKVNGVGVTTSVVMLAKEAPVNGSSNYNCSMVEIAAIVKSHQMLENLRIREYYGHIYP